MAFIVEKLESIVGNFTEEMKDDAQIYVEDNKTVFIIIIVISILVVVTCLGCCLRSFLKCICCR